MLRCNLKELFPLAMTPGVDGFRAEIQLTWDEFSRMRNSLFDALHFLRFTLIGTGLLPLPAANCQSFRSSHLFQLALAVPEWLSCWLASLACCSLWTLSNLQWQRANGGILGCGRLLGRSCYGAQTMARFGAIFPSP